MSNFEKIKGLSSIMLIDDDQSTNFINKLIIRKSKIPVEVQAALNGQEALDHLKKLQSKGFSMPDLIIIDLNMTLMNGFEFLEEYSKLNRELKKNIILIMLTTSLNPEDERKALANPAIDGFLSKPFTLDKFKDLVQVHFAT